MRASNATAAGLAAAVLACGGSDGGVPTLASQLETGQAVYAVQCASCHELDGGIGPRLTPRVLEAYGTVGDLDRYVRTTMPYGMAGSLTDGVYRAIAAFLVASRRLIPLPAEPDAPALGPAADSTRLVAPAGGQSSPNGS